MTTDTVASKGILTDKVEEYRAGEFERMGFGAEAASEMAQARDRKNGGYTYDVHATEKALKDLMMHGCSPELAVQIVL